MTCLRMDALIVSEYWVSDWIGLLIECVFVFVLINRFPDNFEKLSPPILQLDEVEFYYSPDQKLFNGLCVSADLESRICIVRNKSVLTEKKKEAFGREVNYQSNSSCTSLIP